MSKKQEKKTVTIKVPSIDFWKGLTVLLLILVVFNLYLTNKALTDIKSITGRDVVPTSDQPTQPQQEEPPSRVQVSEDDDPVKGNENAPVTIIEFSDFQCPFCGRFYQQTLPQIEELYIDTGKVKLVYRDFPLSFHENAQKSAEASECADEQNKFWEMHDKIFENQNALDTVSLKQYAGDLGLDTEKFNQCLDSGKYRSETQEDFQDGQSYGVSGTPTFFINGQKVVGAQPFSVFRQVIEAELAG